MTDRALPNVAAKAAAGDPVAAALYDGLNLTPREREVLTAMRERADAAHEAAVVARERAHRQTEYLRRLRDSHPPKNPLGPDR